jgi:ferredoxin
LIFGLFIYKQFVCKQKDVCQSSVVAAMAYVVTEACIKCKYTDCVEVCPVDCFREGENMLVINPDECIDCAACVPECPVNAIEPDNDAAGGRWLEHNREFAALWPVIARRKEPVQDADEYKNGADKFARFFSPNPAAQD